MTTIDHNFNDDDFILRENRFRYRFPVKQIERSRLIQRRCLRVVRALLATLTFSFCPRYSTFDLSFFRLIWQTKLTLFEYLELIFFDLEENKIIVITTRLISIYIWSFSRRLIIIITRELHVQRYRHCSIQTIPQLFFSSFFYEKEDLMNQFLWIKLLYYNCI